MGVAIVAMVKHGAHDLIHPIHNHSILFVDGINDTLLKSDFGEGCHNWHPAANVSVSTETGVCYCLAVSLWLNLSLTGRL